MLLPTQYCERAGSHQRLTFLTSRLTVRLARPSLASAVDTFQLRRTSPNETAGCQGPSPTPPGLAPMRLHKNDSTNPLTCPENASANKDISGSSDLCCECGHDKQTSLRRAIRRFSAACLDPSGTFFIFSVDTYIHYYPRVCRGAPAVCESEKSDNPGRPLAVPVRTRAPASIPPTRLRRED